MKVETSPLASTPASPASLPPVIPLVRHVPGRRAFEMRGFDAANVRTATDLPPYLVLGTLDEGSFTSGPDGWSAVYQGCEPDTRLRLAFHSTRGGYDVQETWLGIDGNRLLGYGSASLNQVVGELLHVRFPPAWSSGLPAALKARCHVRCVAAPEQMPTVVGVPDGPMRTVVVPVARGWLRSVRDLLADIAGQSPRYPFAADARLVTQVLHYDERLTASWFSAAKALNERSISQTGIAPLGRLEFAIASNGLATRALSRAVYVVFVTVPWAGLVDLLGKLSEASGLIGNASDSAPGIELMPLVLPAGMEQSGANVDVWSSDQSSGCEWRFADPCGRAPDANAVAIARSADKGEALLQAAEAAAEKPMPVTLGRFLAASGQGAAGLSPEEGVRLGLLSRLPKLLEHERFRKALTKALRKRANAVLAAVQAGDLLDADVWEDLVEEVVKAFNKVCRCLVTLSWDSGASWIWELAGIYTFSSTDHSPSGPFDSLQGALGGNESFSMPTPDSDVVSKHLPKTELLRIARGVVCEDSPVWVNRVKYVLVDGELCPAGEEGSG